MSSEKENAEAGVWLFNGDNGRFASGVFTRLDLAEQWIFKNQLSGVLTWYPLDTGVYEWVINKGYWQPKREDQKTAKFIQGFSSASAEHYHYENGQHG
jgi:hypothetical protein